MYATFTCPECNYQTEVSVTEFAIERIAGDAEFGDSVMDAILVRPHSSHGARCGTDGLRSSDPLVLSGKGTK